MKYFFLSLILLFFYGCISRYNVNNERILSDKEVKLENTDISFPLPNNFKYITIFNDEQKKISLINTEQKIKLSLRQIEIEDDSNYGFIDVLEVYNALLKSPVQINIKNILTYNDKKYAEIILQEENKLTYLVSYKNEIVEISAHYEKNDKILTKQTIENIIKYLK